MNINATLFAQMITFGILIWVTMKFIWPPLAQAMDERAQRIAEGLAAADRAKAELQDNQILDKAKADALLEGARQKAIAQTEIEGMVGKARETLRGQVAALAVQGAQKIIQREINPDTHKVLLDQLVTEI